jgi:glutamate N-acetyltransferase/amino-acid N-acetyltransferase
MNMTQYNSKEEYEEYLKDQAILPAGFRCAATSLSFFPQEKKVNAPMQMNLSLLFSEDEIKSFGAVFTRNTFCGAPVSINKKRLSEPFIHGILINNKISNVCTRSGIHDAEDILSSLGDILHRPSAAFLPASTGIIGWRLPVREIKGSLPGLVQRLPDGNLLDVAKAIMTTDSFPKVRTHQTGDGRITAIAKGAGMIEPNMATMLVFILTDITISRQELRKALRRAAEESFNKISIDSDQSTSDMAVCLSSGKKECESINHFNHALTSVCKYLAEDIVRNGEGTSHVIKVIVSGTNNIHLNAGIGKAIVNSPLVKTAMFGDDPNTGRIVAAIGDYLGNNYITVNTEKMVIRMAGIEIFSNMAFTMNQEKEARLSAYLKECRLDPKIKGYPQHDKTVDIEISFGNKSARTTIIGSDLSYEYVRENADYRS